MVHYLLIFCIIANQDAINSLQYSPKINKETFSLSECCNSCQWWAVTTGHCLLIFCIIANQDAINSLKYSPKSIKTHFLFLIAVVVANGGLLLTTGNCLLMKCRNVMNYSESGCN